MKLDDIKQLIVAKKTERQNAAKSQLRRHSGPTLVKKKRVQKPLLSLSFSDAIPSNREGDFQSLLKLSVLDVDSFLFHRAMVDLELDTVKTLDVRQVKLIEHYTRTVLKPIKLRQLESILKRKHFSSDFKHWTYVDSTTAPRLRVSGGGRPRIKAEEFNSKFIFVNPKFCYGPYRSQSTGKTFSKSVCLLQSDCVKNDRETVRSLLHRNVISCPVQLKKMSQSVFDRLLRDDDCCLWLAFFSTKESRQKIPSFFWRRLKSVKKLVKLIDTSLSEEENSGLTLPVRGVEECSSEPSVFLTKVGPSRKTNGISRTDRQWLNRIRDEGLREAWTDIITQNKAGQE